MVLLYNAFVWWCGWVGYCRSGRVCSGWAVDLSLSLKRDLDISLQVLPWEKVLDGVEGILCLQLGSCRDGTAELVDLGTTYIPSFLIL
jgi:hypothetical protein